MLKRRSHNQDEVKKTITLELRENNGVKEVEILENNMENFDAVLTLDIGKTIIYHSIYKEE